MSDRTHYDVIEADPRASKADLKAAYTAALEAAQESGDADEVAAVRRAWQVLSDPVQRQRYDDQLGLTGRGGPGAVAAVGGEVAEGELDGDADGFDDGDVEVLDGAAAPEAAGTPFVRSEQVPEFLEQPTIGRRLTASLIDAITLVAVVAATSAIALALLDGDQARVIAVMVLFEGWVVGLFCVPTLQSGQTLGKRLTYVMTVDRTTGNLPSVGQVLRRYVVPMVAVPALFQMGAFLALFFGLSYTMGRDQLSLADRLAKTVVVVARYKPAPAGTDA